MKHITTATVHGSRRAVGWVLLAGFWTISACGSDLPTPPGEPGATGALTQITAGGWHSCAIAARGAGAGPKLNVPAGPAVCWGSNDVGQLGIGSMSPATAEPTVVVGEHQFNRLTAGRRFTCGLTREGVAYCWGGGPAAGVAAPTLVSTALTFATLSAGDAHVCGTTSDHALYCWGANERGQLGDESTVDRPQPTLVPGHTFQSVSAGGNHSCAVTPGQRAYCWGDNTAGQLGLGFFGGTVGTPTAVLGPDFAIVAAGGSHTCGLTPTIRTGGKPAFCWGSNATGQLGTRSVPAATAQPVEVSSVLAFREITAGAAHTCGVVHNFAFGDSQAANNLGFCWGSNLVGQIGNERSGVLQQTPDSVHLDAEFQAVAGGSSHTCAIAGNGGFCWGDNEFGQLGNDVAGFVAKPQLVVVGGAT